MNLFSNIGALELLVILILAFDITSQAASSFLESLFSAITGKNLLEVRNSFFHRKHFRLHHFTAFRIRQNLIFIFEVPE